MKYNLYIPHNSFWPLLVGFWLFSMMFGFVIYFFTKKSLLLLISFVLLSVMFTKWMEDFRREGFGMGLHSSYIHSALKWTFALFIFSEVMFFFSFFWAFFHSSICVNCFLGSIWPPVGVKTMEAFSTPTLNTVILLSSGASVTYSHMLLMQNKGQEANRWLIATICLGFMFTRFQLEEYKMAGFTMSDSVYGSCFFMATGFHGCHVMIGSMFLCFCLYQMGFLFEDSWHENTSYDPVVYEMAIWYWHFVDVVWLFLFICVYVWGS